MARKLSPEDFAQEIGPSLGWKKPNAEYVRQMCRRYLEPDKHKQGADMPKGWTCEKSGRSMWLWRLDDAQSEEAHGFISWRFPADEPEHADAKRSLIADAIAYSKALPPSLVQTLCAIQKDVAETGNRHRVILEFASAESLPSEMRTAPIVYKLTDAGQELFEIDLEELNKHRRIAYKSIAPMLLPAIAPIGAEQSAVYLAFTLWWLLHVQFSKEERTRAEQTLGTANIELVSVHEMLKDALKDRHVDLPYVIRQLRIRCINCGKEKRPPRADRKYCDTGCTRAFSKWINELKSKSDKIRSILMDARLEEINANLLLC